MCPNFVTPKNNFTFCNRWKFNGFRCPSTYGKVTVKCFQFFHSCHCLRQQQHTFDGKTCSKDTSRQSWITYGAQPLSCVIQQLSAHVVIPCVTLYHSAESMHTGAPSSHQEYACLEPAIQESIVTVPTLQTFKGGLPDHYYFKWILSIF